MAVVTISRQYGSGGTEIAARVCELLDYRCLDKLLMTQVATEVGLSVDELADFSEKDYKVRTFLDRLLFPGPRSFAQVAVRMPGEGDTSTVNVLQLEETRCAALVHSAIHNAYKQGNVVIVGRGGQAILQKSPGVFHVRIEAPLDKRVLRIQTQQSLGPDEARDLAKRHDQTSALYLKSLFKIKWDDPALYHVTINTGKTDVEMAARLIVCGAEQT